ncbi:putative cytochrome c signal peptide protein [Phenylobacterium zucineum HLK1]|uniref:Putative cytochrome c signal peptide protein n=1 Tax=Phenylobacterium zucineum (strain HLK1) TaxID=450851 RepID=B4R819_PHEZH|nr:cytochrome c [Phenylobacterium zucineum]ACG77552.1 putative cytochrome c signal peptide protein [Phenylobacterium zucineum HLK1]
MAIGKSRGAVAAIALGIGAAVAATGAFAHNEPMPKGPMSAGARAAHQRHANFEKLGAAFKALNDELRKGNPNAATVQAQTKTMASLATALPTWFPRGSGVEARPKSEAKANIWTDAAGFSAVASAMQVQVSKLNQAALSGDMDAVKAQVRPTGASCKACHDKYRQQKD